MKNVHFAILSASIIFAATSSAFSEGLPRKSAEETYPGIGVEYGSVSAPGGPQLRTIVTKPEGAKGRLPALFLAGWLSCDSVEAPPKSRESTARVLQALATRTGMLFYRLDKPGVGDSEGVCGETDFDTELAGYRAGFRQLAARLDVDPNRIFIFGWSNGGGFAPLGPEGKPVSGYVVSGGWVKTWFEHMMEFERRRLTLAGKPPGELIDTMRATSEFYDLYLNRAMLPSAVLAAHPELARAWDDEPTRQYGRPASFYWQLQKLNLASAWEHVDVPVLVLHGEYDFIMGRADHELIAGIVNARHSGLAKFVEVPKMDHSFALHDSAVEGMTRMGSGPLAEDAITMMVEWLKGKAGAK